MSEVASPTVKCSTSPSGPDLGLQGEGTAWEGSRTAGGVAGQRLFGCLAVSYLPLRCVPAFGSLGWGRGAGLGFASWGVTWLSCVELWELGLRTMELHLSKIPSRC